MNELNFIFNNKQLSGGKSTLIYIYIYIYIYIKKYNYKSTFLKLRNVYEYYFILCRFV